jgi:Ca2+-binding RTX toxin-like protein
VENLTLLGNFTFDGTGNALNNVIVGNDLSNHLDGGAGNDTLRGGAGQDTYFVDSPGDVIEELPNQGDFDEITVGFSYTLGDNLEHLILTGNGNFIGTGNGEQNRLVGNEGNNILRGLTGDDNLEGSDGNDTLEGGDGNDRLEGGLGNDSLIGGIGNDFYLLDNPMDTVVELPNQGNDTIRTSFTYSLENTNLENLILEASQDINGTGNEFNNRLEDNFGVNRLRGLGGNDTLYGADATDTLEGGANDDIYNLINPDTRVIEEANGGTDTVFIEGQQDMVTYHLTDNVENLTLEGIHLMTGIGNSMANVLRGNSGSNILDGLDNNDTLIGGAGEDLLEGGINNDLYTGYTGTFDHDTIDDTSGTDTLDVSNFNVGDILSWTALDGDDADNFVDSLEIDFPSDVDSVLIRNYFNNTATTAAQSGAGNGLIESIRFVNQTLTFADVQALPQIQTLAIQGATTKGSSVSDADINQMAADMSAYPATTDQEDSLSSQGDSSHHPELLQLVASG